MANNLPGYVRPAAPGKSLLVYIGNGIDPAQAKLALAAWNHAAGSPLFKLTKDPNAAHVVLGSGNPGAGLGGVTDRTKSGKQIEIAIRPGSDEYHLIAHELGHALGIGHTGDETIAAQPTNLPRVMGAGLGLTTEKPYDPATTQAPVATGEARLAAEIAGFLKPSSAQNAAEISTKLQNERL